MTRLARWIEDPRVLTICVVALVSLGLWVATWSQMARMDMSAMGMGVNGSMSGGMNMDTMAMGADWSMSTIISASGMWILMMAAMMLPAMAPIAAVYAGIAAKEDRGTRLIARVFLFLAGYFLLWALFSVLLALAQLALRDSVWFTMGGTLATPLAAAVLMVIAGAYQFSSIKDFCLHHCRHPLTFLMQHWREGLTGAFPVGLRHGVYCFGCCVAFMGLMFVFGAMNVWWMAVIALYFLAEKIAPRADVIGRVTGALLLLAGAGTAITVMI